MLDAEEMARLLDVLGNRNRRRIIELLKQKPCYVTEISERLVISPKAVIEHLQLLEREEILRSCADERRRKYYFLMKDFTVRIELGETQPVQLTRIEAEGRAGLINTLSMLRRMYRAREELMENLELLERDIDAKIFDAVHLGEEFNVDERDIEVLLALAYYDLTIDEIDSLIELERPEIEQSIDRLVKKGIVRKTNKEFCISGLNAR